MHCCEDCKFWNDGYCKELVKHVTPIVGVAWEHKPVYATAPMFGCAAYEAGEQPTSSKGYKLEIGWLEISLRTIIDRWVGASLKDIVGHKAFYDPSEGLVILKLYTRKELDNEVKL